MSNIPPPSVISQLIHDATQDPQLPRPKPTEAFWQLPPSPLSTHQSQELPSNTTYAIIGSGITGCSVAKNLLEILPADSPATAVTVLEARALTSGATGRNGGHLVSPLPEEFAAFEKILGAEETSKLARFANRTLESMYALAGEDDELRKVSEARRVRSVCAFYDESLFGETERSVRRYEECLPEEKGDSECCGADEARDKYNMKDAAGVITTSAGAFWPYRLITTIFTRLLTTYPTRFSLETHTPVSNISLTTPSNPEYPYTLHTPRGKLLASKIIHCTNAHTSHLLPSLRGKIWPLRGTMSVQSCSRAKHEGAAKSWSTMDLPRYDSATGEFSYGLYYITQNAHSGDYFVGGEKVDLKQAGGLITSDDTTISSVSSAALRNVLARVYDRDCEEEDVTVKKIWSGIMGFTPDHMPWVGRLPPSSCSATPESGGGEYIAAGFNGYGMPLCWGCGEAVAKLLVGQRKEEIESWFPASFWISEERLGSAWTSTEAGIYNMLMQEVPVLVGLRLAVGSWGRRVWARVFG